MKLICLALVLGFAFIAVANGELEADLDKVEASEEFADDEDASRELDEVPQDPDESLEGTDQSHVSELENESEDTLDSKDAKPRAWWRRRRSRRRRSRRRRRRGWSLRRRIWSIRRRIRFVGGRRRRFFTKRYWNRKFFPSCRRSSFHYGSNPRTSRTIPASCINAKTVAAQARCYAPKIYLAIGEQYKPSSVEFHLSNVKMVKKVGHRLYVVRSNVRANNMPTGASNYFLKSKHHIRTPSSTVPFFSGQNPRYAPVYAMWRQFRSGGATIRDFIYWTFYPYNRGKNVCIGLAKIGKCFGGCTVMGNHVGDWEHVTVRLKNNKPWKMEVGAHNFGGVYTWNGRTFVKGKDFVKISAEGHPMVFSAQGSHGLWTKRGRIKYKDIKNGEKLYERVSTGTAWNSWTNLRIIQYIKGKHYTGNLMWMNFKGRWGDPKRGCAGLEKISGECRFNSGPEGPGIKSVMTKHELT